jgi:uncharacterized protein (TIGR03067 family)
MNGRAINDPESNGSKLSFRGDELIMQPGRGNRERHVIDEVDTTVNPRAFCTRRVEPAREQTGWMIYALKGEQLKIAFFDALKARPDTFEPREDLIILELKKEMPVVGDGKVKH